MAFLRSVISRGAQTSQMTRTFGVVAPRAFTAGFHSQRIVRNEAVADAGDKVKNFALGLKDASRHELFAYTSKFHAVALPVALLLSPSIINLPVDLAMGIVLPVHMHIGMSGVIEDYVPNAQQNLAFTALLVVTGVSGLGLLKINLCGAGMTESLKSLWRAPKPVKED